MYKSNFLAINLSVKVHIKVYYTYTDMYVYTIYTMGRPIKTYNQHFSDHPNQHFVSDIWFTKNLSKNKLYWL